EREWVRRFWLITQPGARVGNENRRDVVEVLWFEKRMVDGERCECWSHRCTDPVRAGCWVILPDRAGRPYHLAWIIYKMDNLYEPACKPLFAFCLGSGIQRRI